jgi:hypothetical protein
MDSMTPIERLVLLVVLLFAVMKMVVLVVAKPKLTIRNRFAFLIWPGMHPHPFISPGHPAMKPLLVHLPPGLLCLGTGIALMGLAGRGASHDPGSPWLFFLGLPGLSLAFHFGLLRIWTGVIQSRGYAVRLLFPNPFHARSLSHFWSDRWNRAYSELMTLVFYRPISHCLPPHGALLLTFFVSGLLHEWAISLPVQSGYGGPTAYFLIQGSATVGLLTFQNKLQSPQIARALTYLIVFIPLPLVFHPPFVEGIVYPITQIAGRMFLL